MREASRVNDKAMEWLKSQIKEGVTEQSIAEGSWAPIAHSAPRTTRSRRL